MVGWSDPFDLRRSHGTGRLALMALMVVGSVGAIIAGAILLGRAHNTPGWQFRQKTKHFTSSGERAVLEKANFIVKSPWSSSHYHWVYDQSINEFGSQQTSNPRLMPSVDLRSTPTSLPLATCLTVYGDSQALLNLPACPDGSGHGIAAFSWRESVTLELPDGKQCDAKCCTDNGGRWGADGCHFYEIPARVCVKALKTIAGWVYMGSCQDDGSHTTWTPATYGLAYRVMPALEIRSPSDPVLAYAPYANSASQVPKVAKSWAGHAPQWWLGLALLLAGCLLLLSAVVAMALRVQQWRKEEKLLHESQPRSDAGIRPTQVIA